MSEFAHYEMGEDAHGTIYAERNGSAVRIVSSSLDGNATMTLRLLVSRREALHFACQLARVALARYREEWRV